jgi:hypothetical protein
MKRNMGMAPKNRSELIMSESAVQEILDRIQQLPDDDRLLLEERLATLAEAEWRRAAAAARQSAGARGIDQAAIDRAIDELRHPS